MAVSHSDSSLSRAGLRRCGAGSGKASAIIASTVAIALVLPIRRDERVIALPLCPTLSHQLLTDSWREAGRIARNVQSSAFQTLVIDTGSSHGSCLGFMISERLNTLPGNSLLFGFRT
jgi:hypothetical protein